MGIARSRVSSTVVLVCAHDPDVDVDPTEAGTWMDRSSKAVLAVRAGADTVAVGPLSKTQHARCLDMGGRNQQLLALASSGVQRVNDMGGAAVADWIEAVKDSDVIGTLGLYVEALTSGRDPEPNQRALWLLSADGRAWQREQLEAGSAVDEPEAPEPGEGLAGGDGSHATG
ncbi:MAG: hypothetical protein ACYTFV_02600 [Planctomycetota bacterium]|jgi:hypothetical protein